MIWLGNSDQSSGIEKHFTVEPVTQCHLLSEHSEGKKFHMKERGKNEEQNSAVTIRSFWKVQNISAIIR